MAHADALLGYGIVMVHFLASIIEWFAVLALSVMGIGYQPAQSCASPEPTEFRQAVVWIPSEGSDPLQSARFAAGRCNMGTDLVIYGQKPSLLAHADSYNG
jgi:hypothetical protein